MPSPTIESPAVAAGSGPPRAVPGWWPWAAGALLGMVVLGPGLGGGSLLSLDLLVTPHIPVPNGVWGLGPALSQRVPLFAVLGMGSWVVGGPVITKVLVVVWSAAAFAGAARLARRLSPNGHPAGLATQAAAGLLWAGGPFALTRLSAGHINLLYAIAVLPWALPRLCRPAEHLPATFLAAVALAVGGPGGGTLGITVVAVALVLQPPPRRWAAPVAVVAAANVIWLAPTAVLLWAGAGVTGAGGFRTHAPDLWSWPAGAAGDGFWRADVQAGAGGLVGGLGGLAVVALAAVGTAEVVRARGGWRSWPGVAAAVAVLGLALSVASAVPVVRDAYRWTSDLSIGAPLRESHRFTSLWLVWAAPTAALGAAALGRRLGQRRAALAPLVPLVALVGALVLSVPGWWGLDGRLQPVTYPAGWAAARTAIAAAPGTAVAFPWSEYPPLDFAGGRQVFNPLPEYLGGDVISSYDPVFHPGDSSQEQVDRRAEVVDHLSDEALLGHPIAPDLARLGVRWVVLAHSEGWTRYASLASEPGLRSQLATPSLDLYRVVAWEGPAVGPDGATYRLDRPIPPILTTDAPAESVLDVAGAPGWLQGWGTPVDVTADGRLRLRGSGGLVWFWPAPVLAFADLSVLVGACWAVLKVRRELPTGILAPGSARG